ncbi:hypothetical protein HV417_02115 [Bacillus sporothermodurans]|uniref:hypothetical protein n=1 Tax=Heyndrickxia sporothermodurans TaxID=46224 RepID=UPI00192B4D34|nr:hypothetical protein [Heyndrickxia sporothermodurans]MBL5830858.1 hypothetical protein [Heyndrickxia sporothermodurans]MBL5872358.1 hypothetical protein [Heyndrickxia sporothermodurans]
MANIVDIIVNARDNASGDLRGINKALKSMGDDAGKVTAVLSGVVGSIGAMGPAVAGVGALSSSFMSAGIGAGAFGAVAVSSIGKVVDASEKVAQIEEKIKNADSTKERIQAQKELAQVMGGMSKAQQGALKDLQNFQSWWGKFSSQFDPQVFRVFGEGLKFIQNTMTALQPSITAVGNVLGDFLERVNNGFKSESAKNFFDYINKTAGPNLQAVLTMAGNLLMGFFGILRAFTPLSASVNGGLIEMTANFRKWAEGLSQSQGFQTFINYVKANAPVVMSLIGGIFTFVGKLVVALAPLGSVVLNVANSFIQWLNSSTLVNTMLGILSATGQFLLQHLGALKVVLASVVAGFIAFKVITTVVAIVKTGIAVFNALKTVISAVRLAFAIFNVTLLANPITWVIAGIVALIAVGVLLYKNWDTVVKYAKILWNGIKSAWSGIVSAVKNGVSNAMSAVSSWASNMKSKISNMWNDIKSKTSAGVSKMISAVKSMPGKIASFFTQLWSKAKSLTSSGVSAVVSFFKSLPSKAYSALSSLGSRISSAFSSAMSKAKSVVTKGISSMISAIKGWAGKFVSSGKGLLDAFAKGISSGISKAVGAVKNGMSKIRSYLPFSPAKKGPLSDLDKSGEAFFPTWYNGALSRVKPMTRAIGSAMGAMNSSLENGFGSVGLESFSGGRSKMTVTVNHEHSGSVQVQGDTGRETLKMTGQAIQTTTERDIFKDLRQVVRQK